MTTPFLPARNEEADGQRRVRNVEGEYVGQERAGRSGDRVVGGEAINSEPVVDDVLHLPPWITAGSVIYLVGLSKSGSLRPAPARPTPLIRCERRVVTRSDIHMMTAFGHHPSNTGRAKPRLSLIGRIAQYSGVRAF